VADGAIVGSAIVKRMMDAAGSGPQGISQSVQQYCRELLGNV
jgi:tryptophan synthase alpha subunit